MRLEEAYGARGEGLKARLARSLRPDREGLTQGYGSLCLSISVLIPCMCKAEKDGKKTTTFRVRKPDLKSSLSRTSLSLSFALCKMGIPITAFT